MGCRDDRKMANGVGKHKLLVIGPTEPWSVREKLCLATSVMRSGDQNWVSVSRAIKPFAESGRPPDWFSQKHCASKYSELLETTQSPKRKRGEKGEVVETIQDMIVRRLTADRIDELKKLIKETQEKHRKLKREAELIQAGHLDSKLQELWEDIVQKKKLEVEEAEVKRKNSLSTDQARQVTKNTPKRISGNTIYSPSNCSPSHEFSNCDPLECVALDQASTKSPSGSVRLRTISESPVPIDSVSDGSFQDDNVQKNFLVQKATPSPLLSELLKKGNILATKSRLIGEGDMSTAIVTGAHDLQLAIPGQPLSQAAGSPMLSRLLEPGPTPFSPSLDFMVRAESAANAPLSATTAVSVDSSASASSVMQADESAEDKVLYLSEEDVSVSYMGDELDLKTMGDIIAIIEDKADETAEALDAAAVEAALSLCEENGHAFASAWGSGLFQPHESHPSVPKGVSQSLQPSSLHSNLEGKTKVLEHRGGTSASLSSLCSSQDNCLSAFSMGLRGIPPTSSFSFGSKSMEHIHTGETLLPKETKLEAVKMVHKTNVTIKYERRKWAQQIPDTMHRDSVLEDSPLKERHPKDSKVLNGISVGRAQNTSGTQVHIEVNGPGVCGEEEGDDAEGYLSEPDGEDGYSPQTASSSLQLHPTTDSIPSSPASSQFSVCSEDLEALQAHKIWKKAIMLVWRAAANHRYANVFLQPVTDDIAPGYHSIVHRPMDLASIKKNIETGLIRTTAEFQRDIMLMFQNAVMYNSLDHDVYHMGVEMQRDVLEQIQQFLATQLIMETSESGIGAKSLRGRENTQKQDSSDKDAVSMSSPAFLLSLFDGGTRGRRCAIEADLRMKK